MDFHISDACTPPLWIGDERIKSIPVFFLELKIKSPK